MLPTITIGTWTISLYKTMLCVGILVMGVLLVKRRRLYSLSLTGALAATVLTTVFGLIGAKLLGFLQNLRAVLSVGMSAAGFSFSGALYVVPIGMMLLARQLGTTKKKILDAIAPCMAAIVAFLPVGCFLNGCCGGSEVELAGVIFQWPVQAIESFGSFLVLGLILHLEEERKLEGKLYAVFLAGYGVLNLFSEFLRDTEKRFLGLGDEQWLAVLAILISMLWLKSVLLHDVIQKGYGNEKN